MNDKMTRHGDGTADFDLGHGVAVTVPCECPDVTIRRETAQVVYDAIVQSLDFGSGFLSTEEMLHIQALGAVIGVDPIKCYCGLGLGHAGGHRLTAYEQWEQTYEIARAILLDEHAAAVAASTPDKNEPRLSEVEAHGNPACPRCLDLLRWQRQYVRPGYTPEAYIEKVDALIAAHESQQAARGREKAPPP